MLIVDGEKKLRNDNDVQDELKRREEDKNYRKHS